MPILIGHEASSSDRVDLQQIPVRFIRPFRIGQGFAARVEPNVLCAGVEEPAPEGTPPQLLGSVYFPEDGLLGQGIQRKKQDFYRVDMTREPRPLFWSCR